MQTNSIEGFKPGGVALDLTQLYSAASFLTPFRGISDPCAEKSFQTFVDCFVSGTPIYLPLPDEELGQVIPLSQLWIDNAIPIKGLLLADEFYQQSQTHLGSFSDLFNDYMVAAQIAHFCSLHFTNVGVEAFFSRLNLSSVQAVAGLTKQGIVGGKFTGLINAIQKEVDSHRLVIPDEYANCPGFDNPMHFTITHTFCAYMRGWSYALGLAERDDNILYEAHWLRDLGLRVDPDGAEVKRKVQKLQKPRFPWGKLITDYYDLRQCPDNDRISRAQKVVESLPRLRESATHFNKELEKITKEEMTSDGSSPYPSKLETLILDTMTKAKLPLAHKNSTRRDKLMNWLKTTGGAGGLGTLLFAEAVGAMVNSTFLQKVELRLREKPRWFLRSGTWDIYDSTGIRKAASTWAKRNQRNKY